MTSPRRAGDINQAFDTFVAPCSCCGSRMRFELEASAFMDDGSDFETALMTVCWRYRLPYRETAHISTPSPADAIKRRSRYTTPPRRTATISKQAEALQKKIGQARHFLRGGLRRPSSAFRWWDAD